MPPLDKTLKRSLRIKGIDYVVTLSPEAIKVTRKGRRIGMELKWTDIISGDSALAIALQASVSQLDSRKRNKLVKSEEPPKEAEAIAKLKSPSSRRAARSLPAKPPR